MNKYRAYRNRWKARYRAKHGQGLYPPRPWTQEEKQMVMEHSIPDTELSPMIERSISAIQGMRHKIKYGKD